MAEETYEKLDIACQQLNTAIDLFFEDANHFSVITLTGAAEEILGRYMELIGKQSSLDGIVKGTALVHKHLYGEELPHKEFKFRANMARNSIKHLDSDEDLNVMFDSKEEMINMLYVFVIYISLQILINVLLDSDFTISFGTLH